VKNKSLKYVNRFLRKVYLLHWHHWSKHKTQMPHFKRFRLYILSKCPINGSIYNDISDLFHVRLFKVNKPSVCLQNNFGDCKISKQVRLPEKKFIKSSAVHDQGSPLTWTMNTSFAWISGLGVYSGRGGYSSSLDGA